MSGDAGFTIRLARGADHAAVDELIELAYAHDYGPSEHGERDPFSRSEVRAEAYEVWIAVDAAGELLGSVTLRRPGTPPLHEDYEPDVLDLRLLGVSPRARRRGVAAALMRRAIERAREGGFAAVGLKTQPFMEGAHRLYESLGFERAPERDGLWIGGERVLDLLAYRYRLPVAD